MIENENLNNKLLTPEISTDYVAASEITEIISANEIKISELYPLPIK